MIEVIESSKLIITENSSQQRKLQDRIRENDPCIAEVDFLVCSHIMALEFARAFQNNTHLKKVNLQVSAKAGHFSAELIHHLAALIIINPSLETFGLQHRVDQKGHDLFILRDSFFRSLSGSRLKKLRLMNCAIDEAVTPIRMLQVLSRRLKSLDLSSVHISPELMTSLCGAISRNTVFVEDLSLNSLVVGKATENDTGMLMLFGALTTNNTAKHLHLANIQISDVEATALAGVLVANTTLTHLELDGTLIGDKGTKAIARALQANDSLQHLRLTGNLMRKNGTTALLKSLQSMNSTLKTLVLDATAFGKNESEIVAMGKLLTTCGGLQEIHICLDMMPCATRRKMFFSAITKGVFLGSDNVNANSPILKMLGHDDWFGNLQVEYLFSQQHQEFLRLRSKGKTPLSLWPFVLSKVSRRTKHDAMVMFHYLQENPDLFFVEGSSERKRLP